MVGFRCSSHNVGKLCSWSDLAFCVLPLLWSAWLFGLVSVLACPGTSTSVSWHVHSHVQRAHVPLLTEPATVGLATRSAYKLQVYCNYLHFKSDISYGLHGLQPARKAMPNCTLVSRPTITSCHETVQYNWFRVACMLKSMQSRELLLLGVPELQPTCALIGCS